MRHLSRIVVVILVVSLGFVSSFGATTVPTCCKENVTEEGLTLDAVYNMYDSNSKDASLISVEENKYIYEIQNETDNGEVITSHISSYVDTDGAIVLDISENEKQEEVRIEKNGSIYVDGERVIIESVGSIEESTDEITPKAGHRIYWQTGAPYGKSSDYSKYSSKVQKSLKYSKPIKDATIAALITVIGLGLGLSGVGSVALGFVASGLISWFSSNKPSGRAWSILDKKYVHKTKGFNVKSNMSVYRHQFTYYGNTNFTGKIGSGSRFQVFAY